MHVGDGKWPALSSTSNKIGRVEALIDKLSNKIEPGTLQLLLE